MSKTMYVIDGFAQIFRAYYAIRNGMQSPVTGEPTHAVFGFTSMLLKLLTQLDPDYVVVAFDAPGDTFRDELFPEYKATREATPEDLTTQIPRVRELIEGFGIPIVMQEGLEADDVIATIVERVANDPDLDDLNIRIVSRDKDLEQLINDRVTLYDIHKDEVIDAAELLDKKGITPEQVVDMLALVGDTADNVPGVPGIGPKTAATLIQTYGSIEGIYEGIDEIKGKRRENLEASRESVQLAKTLVTLKRDGDFDFDINEAKVGKVSAAKLLPLFQQLGFRRFQEQIKQLSADSADLVGNDDMPDPFGLPGGARSDGDQSAENLSQPGAAEAVATSEMANPGDYRAITSVADLEELAVTLKKQPLISVDIETTGLNDDAQVCGIAFSWEKGQGVYVPMLSPDQASHLDGETVLSVLGDVLADPQVKKCGHNLKFDARLLGWEGVTLRGITFDTMLASIMIDPARSGHKLDQLVSEYLGYEMTPISDLIGDGTETNMAQLPLSDVTLYAAEDTDMTLRLVDALKPKLEELGLAALLEEVEAPLSEILAEMEVNGIMCDPQVLEDQGRLLESRVEELKEKVFEASGSTFNIDSPRQLADVLFSQLGLPPGKKTKTGYSTDIEVLTNLAANEDPNDPATLVPGLIIEYRQLAKLINTYLGNLKEAINPQTKRIHTTFHQLVTATGRLASQNPNLQNIPVRTDIGRQIRKAFHASEGHALIAADYSQIELRVLAHLSEDEGLVRAFQEGEDIHNRVASTVYGVDYDEVTREQRDHAKVINFGIIYGITAFGLARRIEGLDVKRAGELIDDYKTRFPGIDTFLQECITQAMDYGYVTTILGRRRSIPEIKSSNRNQRALGERLAINTVVQGSAADLIKLAMVKLTQRMRRDQLPMKLLLQIHDELVLEAKADEADQLAMIVKEEMENALELKVPLQAEAGTGPDWMSIE